MCSRPNKLQKQTIKSHSSKGAAYMTSETKSRFMGVQRDPEDVKNHLKVGKKLDTGYTSNVPPLEPIQFNPGDSSSRAG